MDTAINSIPITRSLTPTVEAPEFGWLSNPDNVLHSKDDVTGPGVPVAADMLDIAMQSIGAKRLR